MSLQNLFGFTVGFPFSAIDNVNFGTVVSGFDDQLINPGFHNPAIVVDFSQGSNNNQQGYLKLIYPTTTNYVFSGAGFFANGKQILDGFGNINLTSSNATFFDATITDELIVGSALNFTVTSNGNILSVGSLGIGTLAQFTVSNTGNIASSASSTISLCGGTVFSDNLGNFATTSLASLLGNVTISRSGQTVKVKGGSANSNVGTFSMNGVTNVVVAATSITANSRVFITMLTPAGTPAGIAIMVSVTAGTGFTVKGIAADTSVYSYWIIEQG